MDFYRSLFVIINQYLTQDTSSSDFEVTEKKTIELAQMGRKFYLIFGGAAGAASTSSTDRTDTAGEEV